MRRLILFAAVGLFAVATLGHAYAEDRDSWTKEARNAPVEAVQPVEITGFEAINGDEWQCPWQTYLPGVVPIGGAHTGQYGAYFDPRTRVALWIVGLHATAQVGLSDGAWFGGTATLTNNGADRELRIPLTHPDGSAAGSMRLCASTTPWRPLPGAPPGPRPSKSVEGCQSLNITITTEFYQAQPLPFFRTALPPIQVECS